MKCEGSGADLVGGAKACGGCGRAVGLGQRAAGETAHVAKETGAAAGKVGRGLVGGVKGFASGAKKRFSGSDGEKKEWPLRRRHLGPREWPGDSMAHGRLPTKVLTESGRYRIGLSVRWPTTIYGLRPYGGFRIGRSGTWCSYRSQPS